MKLYKLNQGSTFENLKHFIYLTNEYGVPSDEFVDSFIENFGKTILADNFPLSENQKSSESLAYLYRGLDELWKEIEQDCKDNQTTCAYKYGSLFYYIIGSKAVSILKDTVGEQEWNSETEDNKIIYLKTFIEDFDKYITEEYKTEFEKIINDAEKDDNTVVVEPQSTVKHYRLKEEYNSTKGDDSLLDCEIDFNNDIVGTVVSDTEISIDNNIVDIGEYIDKNNIDINSVTIGAYWFDKVYEQY